MTLGNPSAGADPTTGMAELRQGGPRSRAVAYSCRNQRVAGRRSGWYEMPVESLRPDDCGERRTRQSVSNRTGGGYPGEAWAQYASPEDAGFSSSLLEKAREAFNRIGFSARL